MWFDVGAKSKKTITLQQNIVVLRSDINQLILNGLTDFAHATSLKPVVHFQHAETLWQRGTTVTIEANRKNATYTVMIASVKQTSEDRKFINPLIPYSQLQQVLFAPAPPLLQISEVSSNNNLQNFYVKYTFQTPTTGFERFISD